MISTSDIKRERDNVFTIEGRGDENVLVVGSCRCLAYVNYLARYNEMYGAPFRVQVIEPNDYCVNDKGEGLDDLPKAETNPAVLKAVREATVFAHEHYENFGMFNTDRSRKLNIYDFGMDAPIDISIPNFHDRFILFQEQLAMDSSLDRSMPRDSLLALLKERGLAAVEGFRNACFKSSFPQFAYYFRDHWKKRRFFWAGNHVSRFFTLYIWREITNRLWPIATDDTYWQGAASEDWFAKPCTPMTHEDVAAYGLEWDEEAVPLVL